MDADLISPFVNTARLTTLALLVMIGLGLHESAVAQSGVFSPEAFELEADLRISAVDVETGWLDSGFGKLREGGDAGGDLTPRLRLAAVDLAWEPQFNWELSGLVSLSGLIVPIGEWVLKDACRQAAQWPDAIKVAVNFSTVQFQSEGLRNTVFQALATSGLAPDRLEVEITESLFLADSEAILATLRGFKELGVRIALDDFGTGYSSLSYLRKFPFDKVKIDRSFITELLEDGDAGAVVAAITQLASALGMETTAEGVEHPEQVDLLREHGCTNVQGFYFSKPVPGEQVLELLEGGALRRSA